jgi:bifunctional non-homologous end joining protein LigD
MTPTPADDAAVTADDLATRALARGRMPGSIRPMLATEARETFDSPDYIFEAKWGGLRAMAHIRDDVLRLRARNCRDFAPYLPELAGIPDRVRAREAIIDGEIIGVDGEGHPSFDMLRPRLHLMADDARAPADGEPAPPLQLRIKRVAGRIAFQAFDLLWLDGQSLIDEPLWYRKSRLGEIVTPAPEFAPVDFVDDEGTAFFEAMVARRMDGVVAKLKQSPYVPGTASRTWLDVRALQSGDFVVGGYTIGGARRKGEPFSQLLLGGYADGRFEFVGAVSGGLRDAEARELVRHLEPLHAETPPFFDPPPIARLIYWTMPEVVCHVRFSEWTRQGHLRFPIFSALRPDLSPEDCVVD